MLGLLPLLVISASTTGLCPPARPVAEVGSVQPIAELAALARARGVLMHTDAAQSLGKVPVDVSELGVDMLTIVGHKASAPAVASCCPAPRYRLAGAPQPRRDPSAPVCPPRQGRRSLHTLVQPTSTLNSS